MDNKEKIDKIVSEITHSIIRNASTISPASIIIQGDWQEGGRCTAESVLKRSIREIIEKKEIE